MKQSNRLRAFAKVHSGCACKCDAPCEDERAKCAQEHSESAQQCGRCDILPRTARIYIASPYTNGNSLLNVRNSMAVADELWRMGYTPFLPLLSHYWDLVSPKDYEEWMQWDLRWLLKCDAVVRLPGESKGADREVALAEKIGIPVYYYSLEDLKQLDSLPYQEAQRVKVDKGD